MSIENKTLPEVLTKCKDRKIKIGAVGGNSFFFCGPCELFIERADDYDKDLKAAANNAAISARKLFEGLLKKPPTLSSYVSEEIRDGEGKPTFDGYIKAVSAWMMACVRKRELYQTAMDRADNFQEVMKRQVVSIKEADKAVDEGYLIIIIRGFERGKFWMSEEVKDDPFGLVGDTEEDDEE